LLVSPKNSKNIVRTSTGGLHQQIGSTGKDPSQNEKGQQKCLEKSATEQADGRPKEIQKKSPVSKKQAVYKSFVCGVGI
jgi:hypothetical protein